MPADDEKVIARVLDHVFLGALAGAAGGPCPADTSDRPNSTPLGATLYWLARIARGQETATIDVVSHAVRAVLAVIFWSEAMGPAAMETFYDSDPLGQILIRAKWLSVRGEDAVSIESAATALAFETATLRQWMLADVIEFLRDDRTGQLFMLRADVERIRARRDRSGMAEWPSHEDVPESEPAQSHDDIDAEGDEHSRSRRVMDSSVDVVRTSTSPPVATKGWSQ